MQNLETAFRGERLGARDDSLGAVDDTPPAGKLDELERVGRMEGVGGEGHGGRAGVVRGYRGGDDNEMAGEGPKKEGDDGMNGGKVLFFLCFPIIMMLEVRK